MQYVQFTDNKQEKIGAVFFAPPIVKIPNSGEVEDDDERLKEFYATINQR